MPIRPESEYLDELAADRSFVALPDPNAPKLEPDRGVLSTAFHEAAPVKWAEHIGYSSYWNSQPAQEGFDPYTRMERDGLGGHARILGNARSDAEYNFLAEDIRRQNADAQRLADAGVSGVAAQLAFGMIDPINFIPVVGLAGKAYKAAGAGRGLAAAAATSVVVGAGSQAVEEAALRPYDANQTPESMALSIAANGILSGVLGTSLTALANPQSRTLLQGAINDVYGESTVGAAQRIPDVSFGDYEAAPSLGIMGIAKSAGRLTTGRAVRMMESPSLTVREANATLHENIFLTKGNLEGKAGPVPLEVMKKLEHDQFAGEFTRAMLDTYGQYRASITGRYTTGAMADIADAFGAARRKGVLTQDEFGKRVADAQMSGGKDINGDPFIERAAAAYKKFDDMVGDRAVAAGLLENKLDNHFTRVYNKTEITANQPKYRKLLASWYKSERDKADADAAAIEQQLKTAKQNKVKLANAAELRAQLKDLRFKASKADAELLDNAHTTLQRITRNPYGLAQYFDNPDAGHGAGRGLGVRGALKSRVLDIPDNYSAVIDGEVVHFKEMLVRDPVRIVDVHSRTLLPDIMLYEKYGAFTPDGLMARIEEDYAKVEYAAKTPKERAKIAARKKQDMKDVKDSFEIFRGQFDQPDDYFSTGAQALRIAKGWNFVRLMGGITLSSISDIGGIVLTEGLWRVFSKSLTVWTAGMRKSLIALDKEELKALVVASENVMNSRWARLSDFEDLDPTGTKIDRMISGMGNALMKVSLFNAYTDATRSLKGMLAQDRILKLCEQVDAGKINKYGITTLASGYIDDGMARRIAAQFKKYGAVHDGLSVANMRNWDDADAMTTLRAALRTDTDRAIVMPGAEKSTWLSTRLGSTVGQFKSFTLSSTYRVGVRSAQNLKQGDIKVLTGLTTLVGLGMLSYAAKTLLAGRDLPDNPQTWLMEGIDRSGAVGWLMEANNITEKITGNTIGLRALVGADPASRYFNRNFLETILGPSAGMVQDASEIFGAAGMAAAGERQFTQSDLNKMIRLGVPFQTLVGVRQALDLLSDEVSDTLDLQKKGK